MLTSHTEYLKRKNGNGHQRSLDVSDIEGTKPRRLLHRKVSHAGSSIMDSSKMLVPAGSGRLEQTQEAHGVQDLFGLQNNYKSLINRNPLSTTDINGGVKVNQYGQKLYKPQAIKEDDIAGGFKEQQGSQFNNYYGKIMQGQSTKN